MPRPERSWEAPVDTRPWRYQMIEQAIFNVHIGTRAERTEAKPGPDSLCGDYLEFGVFEGSTFLHAHHRARDLMPWMRFFAFDSFEGLPEPEGIDAGGEFAAGQFACSQARFEEILAAGDADRARIEIVPGWFDASLTAAVKRERRLDICAIAWIDCDLYQSVVPVLRFLTDLVRPGTILIFDDWYVFKGDPRRGVQRATREWLADNPQLTLERWHPFCHHGLSFIVQRTMGDES